MKAAPESIAGRPGSGAGRPRDLRSGRELGRRRTPGRARRGSPPAAPELRPRHAAPVSLRPRDGPGAPRRTRPRHAPRSPSRFAPAATARGRLWGRSWRWTAAPATPRPRRPTPARWSPCSRRCCAATTSSSTTSAAPAAPDVVDCPTLQAGLVQEQIAIGECANQLGPSYAGYTTGEAADDLDAVRRALGLGKVFFYGDSYGTFFGQAYAARHPGSLRGLILDSAYPGDDPYYRTLLPAGLHGLRVACRLAPPAPATRSRG